MQDLQHEFQYIPREGLEALADYLKLPLSSLYSMAVQVKMSFTNEGQYLGQRVVIYPAYISDDPNVNHYQPRRVNAQEAKPVRDAIQRDTAFNLPELKEEDGFAVMEFPYLAATDDVMLPEDDED